ncbi:MAG: hypothetical protein AAGD06_10710 [Acidobacteriota bacterium]
MTSALLLDLWYRGRWRLAILGGGLTLLAALFLGYVRPEAAAARADLGFGVLGIVLVCLGIQLLQLAEGRPGTGYETRLFVLPVSSRRLAATRILALTGVLVAVYGAGGMALARWLDVPPPRPALVLVIASIAGTFLCILWATPDRPGLRATLTTGTAALWTLPALARPGADSATGWSPLDVLDRTAPFGAWGLVAVFAASFPVAEWAIDRHRHGDAVPPPSARGAGEAAAQAAGPLRPFAHPLTALLRFEAREKGPLALALFLGPWCLFGAVGLTGWVEGPALLSFVDAVGKLVVVLGPTLVAGLVCRVRGGDIGSGLDPVATLRPIPSGSLATSFLLQGALLLGFAWLAAACGTWIAWHGLAPEVPPPWSGPWPRVFGLEIHPLEWVLLALAAGWLQLGALSAILLTGSNRAAALLIGLPYGIGVALLIFRDSVGGPWTDHLVGALPWLVGCAGLGSTVVLACTALRRGLIRGSAIALQATLLGIVVAAVALRLGAPAGPWTFAALGLAAAVLAPWPAASLAVRRNRHR